MAQSGYTPILIYASGTATNVPLAANMTSSASGAELALNYADGKLYFKNSAGVVTLLANTATVAPVTTFSAGTTGFTPSSATSGAVTLAGTLATTNGGTGLTSFTSGGAVYASSTSVLTTGTLPVGSGGTGLTTLATGSLSYGAGTSAFSTLAIGTAGQILTVNSGATAPQWTTLTGVAVTTFSAGTTGFTPSSATSGAVTLAGTLATTNGGTGLTSFTANGVVYASSTSALATGSALQFNGTNLALGTTSLSSDSGYTALNLGNASGQSEVNFLNGTTQVSQFVVNTSGVTLNYQNLGYLRVYGAVGEVGRFTSAGNFVVGSTANLGRIGSALSDANTSFSSLGYGMLGLQNTSNTSNNYTWMTFNESNSNYVGAIGTQNVAHNPASGAVYGDLVFATKTNGAGGFPTIKARLSSVGQFMVGTDAGNSSAGGIHATGPIIQGAAGLSQQQLSISGGNTIQSLVLGVGYYPLYLNPLGALVCVNTSGQLINESSFNANSTGNTVTLKCTGSAGDGIQPLLVWNSGISGNNGFIAFFTETTYTARGSINYNRTAGLTAYNTTSDYRAKDISGPVTDSGNLIDSVPVYMGKMKDATQERPMFLAHETPAYAHTGVKDAVDKDGNPVYQQMDATTLVPVMWAEIQSLRKRLAAAGIA